MSDLARVAALARLMVEQAAAVDAAETALALAKENFRRTEQEDLPELMREVGLTEVKLDDGTRVSIAADVQCGITEANRPAAAEWLRSHGFGGLLKTELIIPFGRGEADAAHSMADKIESEFGVHPEFQELVHPSTLKSFVKEQREKGAPLPDAISVHPFNRAKLKLPK